MHYAYPYRSWRFRFSFSRLIRAELSIITNCMMEMIYGRWHHLIPRYKDVSKLLSLTSSTVSSLRRMRSRHVTKANHELIYPKSF